MCWDAQSWTHLEGTICCERLFPRDFISQKHRFVLIVWMYLLCVGSLPWALGSEVLTPDSHTCNFEGARLVTSCDHGLYLAMAVVTNSYGEAAACSFRQRCLGLSLMKQALLGTEMGIIAQTKKPIDTLLSKFYLNTTSKPWAHY